LEVAFVAKILEEGGRSIKGVRDGEGGRRKEEGGRRKEEGRGRRLTHLQDRRYTAGLGLDEGRVQRT
jgi:hypothetical protein